MFRTNPESGDYCYHTSETARTCPAHGKPVTVAHAEAILVRAAGKNGQHDPLEDHFASVTTTFEPLATVEENTKPVDPGEIPFIVGEKDVDVNDFIKHAKLDLWDSQKAMIVRVLSSFTGEERRRFIKFAINLDHVPIGGFADVKPAVRLITDAFSYPGHPMLPKVYPTRHIIILPAYINDKQMRERLLYAMKIGDASDK